MSALTKRQLIYQKDLEDATVLANDNPERDLFYSIEEIVGLVEGLIGIATPKGSHGKILDAPARTSWFNYEVARRLGYHFSPLTGIFPAIRHQAIEIKHHTGKSVTVDFGRYHPG